MANERIDFKQCLVYIRDGATPANSILVKLGEGSISWTEKRPIEYVKDRGVLDGVVAGDEEPVDVTLDARYITAESYGAEAVTVREAILKLGAAAGWTTVGDACAPFAVDLRLDYTRTCGTGRTERITLPEFRGTEVRMDPKAGTISVPGACNTTRVVVERLGANGSTL